MADKKEKEKPDYEKFTTVDDVDAEIQKQKDLICRRVKERGQAKEAKKEANAGYNEALKEIEEELDHCTGVIDELTRHRRIVVSGKLRSVS